LELEYEDLLSKEPIYIEGVGHIKIPLLSEIFKLRYKTYESLCAYILVDLNKYLEVYKISNLPVDDEYCFYNLIMKNKEFIDMYLYIFSFFIIENVAFDNKNKCFVTFTDDNKIVGKIDKFNFNIIRKYLLQINYLKFQHVETEQVKYKNETARKLAEKMAKANEKKESKNQLTFGKMISKYCADNKNGINFLNIYDLTIYQFYDQWMQHNHIKQCDIQDMIYSNTVSFNDVSAYDSQLWLK
jgi:hypothetical protein